MKRSRPKSILWFERFFVASILLSAIPASLNWIENFSSGDFSREGWSNYVIGQMVATIIAFSIDIGLWYFIAWRASKIAIWLLIVKTSLAFVSIGWVLPSLVRNGVESIIASTLVIQALVAFSIVFLFRQGARSWFQSKGRLPGGVEQDLSEVFE